MGVAYLPLRNWTTYYIGYRDENLPPHHAGSTLADPEPARVAASKLAVDAFLRDLHDLDLPARCVAFIIDGFR